MSGLLNLKKEWEKHWRGMPSFDQGDLDPDSSLEVKFRTPEDREAFAKLLGQTVTPSTRSLWHPRAVIGRLANKRFVTDGPVQSRHPVYVISKGRWESRLTVKSLDLIGMDYRLVIEPQEYDQYAAVVDPSKILVLPFSNLGNGSIPARNWVWKHAIDRGAERHWILDDNIGTLLRRQGTVGFFRLQDNLKTPCGTGATFRAAEDFVDRYENVAMAGFNYFMFASRKTLVPPLYLNTRIYSCILIKNDLPLEKHWRGRYNEDTDLSLRCLKMGWCTVLFNAFLCYKVPTMTMKGGNTDQLYQGDGRYEMAKSLQEQHPDVVTVTRKWGRWQHHVDYSPFRRNKLILKKGVDLSRLPKTNEYGMRLEVLDDDGSAEEGMPE